MRVEGFKTWRRNQHERKEHVRCDPKDSDLCLHGVKPAETRVEAQRGSDVQIDPMMWA
jgi:hypothetical protein